MSEQLTEKFDVSSEVISEIIGRFATIDTTMLWRSPGIVSFDTSKADYRFYDQLRNGMVAGFRLSGIFASTITNTIVTHIFSEGIGAALNEAIITDAKKSGIKYTNGLLTRFMLANNLLFMLLCDDWLSLGEQYVICNMDASLSVPSPDTVEIINNPLDYRNPDGYRITTVTDYATIIDEYTKDKRTLKIQITGSSSWETLEFENLIGVIPVVHIKHNSRTNETNGRPLIEPILRHLERYDSTLERTLDGVDLIANPIPTFEGLKNIQETINANRKDEDGTYVDQQGNEQERKVLHFDKMSAILVGEGGSFKFAGPLVGFTSDVLKMLEHLFGLIMNYSRLPEYVFGNAISSSKASVETQTPPFNTFIRSKRLAFEGSCEDLEVGSKARGGLLQIIDIFLKVKALIDNKVVVGPTYIKWPELSIADQQILLNKIKFAKAEGLISPVETLDQLNIVDNPEESYADAEEIYAQQAQDEFNMKLNSAISTPDTNTADLPLDNTSNNSNPRGVKVNNSND